MKNLLIINAVLATLFGVAFIVIPEQFLMLYGNSTPAMEYIGQLFGTAMLAIAIITWMLRNSTDNYTLSVIALSLFISYAIAFIVALVGQLQEFVNLLGWSTVVIYFLLSISFGYFRFKK